MPAGSGPQAARATAVSVAAAEVALVTIQPSSWSGSPLGNLIGASVNFTAGTAQTLLTLRIRQGTGTGGALVGIAHTDTTVAAAVAEVGFSELDQSAFATGPGQAQTYTLTGQTNAAGPGTVNAALIELETVAPVQ